MGHKTVNITTAILVVLLLAAGTIQSTRAPFTGQTSNTGDSWTAGNWATSAVALHTYSAGTGGGCAINYDEADAVYCWGRNFHSEVGYPIGSQFPQYFGQPVDTTSGMTSAIRHVSAGGWFNCAIDTNGQPWCWGDNTFGQLGDGTTTDSPTPVAVDTSQMALPITSIDAGMAAACAIDTNDQPWCWGWNRWGQLGDGTTTNRSTPVAVNTTLMAPPIQQISAGNGHTCAIDTTGLPYCWGRNDTGQLGNGTTTDSTTPTPVATTLMAVPIQQIEPGGYLAGDTYTTGNNGTAHTCAIDANNDAYCWGRNDRGQLGDTTTTNRNIPVAVDTTNMIGAITDIDTGYDHTCALEEADDNDVWCWGDDTTGELGDGFASNERLTPNDTGSGRLGNEETSVDVGRNISCAYSTTFSALPGECWGDNSSGQTGAAYHDNHLADPSIVVYSTETLQPDAILTAGNLTGNLTDIQGDPHIDDGQWMTANISDADTQIHVSFPTPTSTPATFDQLMFTYQIRRTATGGNDPEAQPSVYESGSSLLTGPLELFPDPPNGFALRRMSFDRRDLNSDDVSNAEAELTGVASTGSPNDRRTVEIGAIQWDLTSWLRVPGS